MMPLLETSHMCLIRNGVQFVSTSQPEMHLHKFLNEHSSVRNTSGKLVLSPYAASKSSHWFGNAFAQTKGLACQLCCKLKFFASQWLLERLTVNWVGPSLRLVQITMHTVLLLCFTVSVPELTLFWLPKGITNILYFSLYFIYGKKMNKIQVIQILGCSVGFLLSPQNRGCTGCHTVLAVAAEEEIT